MDQAEFIGEASYRTMPPFPLTPALIYLNDPLT
jgi:hypothetical protein